MRIRTLLPVLLIIGTLTACSAPDDGPLPYFGDSSSSALFSSAASSSSSSYSGQGTAITIMTWNVLNFESSDAYNRIATVVRNKNVDILLGCEVQTDDADLASFGTALTNAGYWFKYRAASSMSDSYNALVVWSQWPINDSLEILKGSYTDPNTGQLRFTPRSIFRFRVHVFGEHDLWCYGAHLKAGNSSDDEATRRAQAHALEDYIKANHDETSAHIVVLGDMNTIDSRGEFADNKAMGYLTLKSDNPGNPGNDFVSATLIHLPADDYTHTSYNSRLDHIILSPAASAVYVPGSVDVYHPSQYCSDHYPVLLQLEYSDPGASSSSSSSSSGGPAPAHVMAFCADYQNGWQDGGTTWLDVYVSDISRLNALGNWRILTANHTYVNQQLTRDTLPGGWSLQDGDIIRIHTSYYSSSTDMDKSDNNADRWDYKTGIDYGPNAKHGLLYIEDGSGNVIDCVVYKTEQNGGSEWMSGSAGSALDTAVNDGQWPGSDPGSAFFHDTSTGYATLISPTSPGNDHNDWTTEN